MRLYSLFGLLMIVSISYGQTITKDLKVVSKYYEIEVLSNTSLSFANFYSVQPFKNESEAMIYYKNIVDLLNISFTPLSDKLAADRKKYEFSLDYENKYN